MLEDESQNIEEILKQQIQAHSIKKICVSSVSYTHLTLPTILRV